MKALYKLYTELSKSIQFPAKKIENSTFRSLGFYLFYLVTEDCPRSDMKQFV